MKLTKKTNAEVLKVYDTWLHSYLNGDVATYDKYLDDAYHFIGSTQNEEFLNRKDTTNFFEATADQLAGKCELKNEKRTFEKFGELVFVTHLFDAWFLNGADWAYYGRFRFTSALQENKEGWRFIYQHFSTTDSKAEAGETIGFDQVSAENLQLKEAIKRRTFELEAKNRELEVEAALERVRARTMAMQHSDELAETASLLFQQVGKLDIVLWGCSFNIWEPGDTSFTSWWGGRDLEIKSSWYIPLTEEPIFINFDASRKRGDEFFVVEAGDEKLAARYQYMLGLADVGPHLQGLLKAGITFPKFQIDHIANFSHGNVLFITYEPCPEAYDIFKRFAKVFEQTYTRFLDLQKAEAQAREAQIEAALERVRGRALAMHQSEELLAVIQVVSEQLLLLNLSFDTVSFGKNDQEGEFKFWLTASGQPKPVLIQVPFFKSRVLNSVITAQKKEVDFISDVFSPTETKAWSQHLIQHSALKNFPKAVKDFILHSPGFARSSFLMQHIDLYVGNYRAMPFTDEENAIFKRFAQVFAQAYTRFLDLQKAEAQAREAEIELALERVRARSMAMQSSEEFVETSDVMLAELKKLKMNAIRIGICTMDAKTEASEIWSRSETKERLENKILGVVPKGVHPVFDNMVKAWKKKQPYFTDTRTGNEVKEYYKKLVPYLSYPLPKTYNAAETISTFFFQEGSLNVVSHTPLQEDDIKIMLRFSQVFGQVYRRFLDLQKAEAQAREAQIEAALEKVRSRSLAMRQSPELLDVITEIGLQLEILGITLDSSFINIYKDESPKDLTIYIAAGGRTYKEPVFVPFINNPLFTKLLKARKNKDSFYALVVDKKQTIAWWKQFFSNATNIEVPRKRKNYITKSKGIATSVSLGKYASIHMMRYTPIPYVEEENQILMRFGKVFDQVYTRFLDLQKAEAQAREAQIETSLERVRSQAMAMRQSEDLVHCTHIVFDELEKLDLSIERSGIGIFDPETKDCELWTTVIGQDGKKELATGITSLTVHPMLIETFNSWKKQKPYSYILEGMQLEAYYKLVTKSEFVLSEDVIEKSTSLPKEYYHYSPFGAGGLYFFSDSEPAEGDKIIIRRFAEVFDLTYTRYEDLQKAEAQAREAQIEAALERVRSKAMAMRSSEDIGEATTILFKEIEKLEIETMRCGILIIHDTKVMDVWTTSSTKDDRIVRVSGQIDMTIHPLLKNVYRSWKAKESHTEYELKGKDSEKYYEALTKEAHYQLPTSSIVKDRHYNCCFMFNEGALFAFTKYEIPAAAITIFKRFAKVFGLTYQRYRELIESEKREKEAKKQSSLDRVRGEIASMRSTEDLNRITPIIWQELTNLGVPFFRCGIFIMNEDKENIQVYLSDPNGKSLGLMNLDFSTNDLTKNSVEAWRNHAVYKAHWSKEEFTNWTKTLIDLGKIKTKKGYQGGDDAPESLDLHFVPFSQGMLYVGNLKPLTEEQIELVVNLSESFSIAYARYEDFNKLEKAKENVEEALTDLKSAQNQLIQSEKMASLGELTAGIAHEIQNPLNFVNNFSEVSKELLEEMMEEMAKGDMEEVKAIADDIIQNLDKINHHGKRADGIVKGMLQHSRSSTGKKEPTDINILADEYLRLAYHGLRAKDPSFNATLETDYDSRITKINVIPQDLGRVILNLITNAFYAASERKKTAKDPAFMPTVSVKTKQDGENLIISVQDNGQGIPKKVLDKIFQPFFTTKPTGEGTGLGLSMSYDIVTKGHGGELKVVTKAGAGTTFYVNLPVTK